MLFFKKRKPRTFPDFVQDMLQQKDRETAREDRKALEQLTRYAPLPLRFEMFAAVLDRAAEGVRSDENRQCVIDFLMNFRFIVTEEDRTLELPGETRRVNDSFRNLYEQGGEFFRQGLIKSAIRCYNIPPFALRGLFGILMEQEDLFGETISHLLGHTSENARAFSMDKDADGTIPGFPGLVYPLFDYIVRHQDDMTPEAKQMITEYLDKRSALTGNRAAWFRRYYLPDIGKTPDDPLGQWFEETWC